MPGRALTTIWREGGARGCARKLSAAARMGIPLLILRRRTGAGVGAYFDLVTDDSRRFYGDNFHFGYFPSGSETLAEAHDAHTDLVAALAELGEGQRVLDIGCGLGAPGVRMARRHGCEVTGINISREQVRQGREMIAEQGMAGRVVIEHGDARRLPFGDSSFDAIVCVEVAGDICVTEADKHTLLDEMFRVLKPGGLVGFSDLALHCPPSRSDRRVLRSVFYDNGSNLVADWPAAFAEQAFHVPFLAQPAQSKGKIKFPIAANLYLIGQLALPGQQPAISALVMRKPQRQHLLQTLAARLLARTPNPLDHLHQAFIFGFRSRR